MYVVILTCICICIGTFITQQGNPTLLESVGGGPVFSNVLCSIFKRHGVMRLLVCMSVYLGHLHCTLVDTQ